MKDLTYHKNPRKLLNSWEAQALATLTSRGFLTSFKEVSVIMADEDKDLEIRTAAEILFWGRVWRQSKTKEEVITSWDHILRLIRHSNYQALLLLMKEKLPWKVCMKELIYQQQKEYWNLFRKV